MIKWLWLYFLVNTWWLLSARSVRAMALTRIVACLPLSMLCKACTQAPARNCGFVIFISFLQHNSESDLASHECGTVLVWTWRVKRLLLVSQLIALLLSPVTSSIKTSEPFPLAAVHNTQPCYMIHSIFMWIQWIKADIVHFNLIGIASFRIQCAGSQTGH